MCRARACARFFFFLLSLLSQPPLFFVKSKRGDASADVAAGIFFDERRALVTVLHALLEAMAVGGPTAGGGDEDGTDVATATAVAEAFVSDLLLVTDGGPTPAATAHGPHKSSLIARLCELVRDTSLEPSVSSQPAPPLALPAPPAFWGGAPPLAPPPPPPPQPPRLATLVDERGAEVSRAAVIGAERASLAECLLYAVRLRAAGAVPGDGLHPADAAAVVEAAAALALRARPGGPDAAFPGIAAASRVVSAAAIAALVPPPLPPLGEDGAAGATDAADAAARRAAADAGAAGLAADATLASRLEGASAGGGASTASTTEEEGPLAPALRLAWGVLLSLHGPPAARARAEGAVGRALSSGALAMLASFGLSRTALADATPPARRALAAVGHDLVAALLDADVGREAVADLAARSAAVAAGGGAPFDPQAPPPPPAQPHAYGGFPGTAQLAPAPWTALARPDGLEDLLDALTAALTAAPELWLDGRLRSGAVADLLEFAGRHPVLTEAPPCLVAYLRALEALASGSPSGAQAVLNQLRATAAAGRCVSWRAGLGTMREYCARYAGPAAAAAAAAAAVAAAALDGYGVPGSTATPGPGGPPPELAVPAADAAGMAAYARLAAAVLRSAPRGAAASWRAALEGEAGGAPLAELAVQLMCHPVPSAVKAALDALLDALAREPGAPLPLLDRLVSAVVVGGAPALPPSAAPLLLLGGGDPPASSSIIGYPGGPRYDAAYQLAEVEARSEDYSETLALVRLLTTLARGVHARPPLGPPGGPPLGGAPYAHLAAHVRREVLGRALARPARAVAQRWALAAAGLENVGAWLGGAVALSARSGGGLPAPLDAGRAGLGPGAPSGGSPHHLTTPALDAMLDLLGEGDAATAILGVLLPGADALAAEPAAGGARAAREAATLAALRVLRLGLTLDGPTLAGLRAAGAKGGYEPLDALVRRDVRRLGALLDFTRYSPRPAIQAEALRLARLLTPRLPSAVAALLQPPAPGITPPASRVRDGVAACLAAGLFGGRGGGCGSAEADPDAAWDGGGDEDEEAGALDADPTHAPPSSDPRAALVLDLLAAGVGGPAPSLAHLLIGYDAARGAAGVASSVLDGRFGGAAAAPLLRAAAASPALATINPPAAAGCLDVWLALAAHPAAGGPARALLRSSRAVPSGLAAIADAARAELAAAGPAAVAAISATTARLLRLAAEELLRGGGGGGGGGGGERGVGGGGVSGAADLAAALLGPAAGGEPAALALLSLATGPPGGFTPPPPFRAGPGPDGAPPLPADVRAAAAFLGLDALLSGAEGGTASTGPRSFLLTGGTESSSSSAGVPVYDVPALAAELRGRMADAEAAGRGRGGRGDAATPPPPAPSAARAACRAALAHATECNGAAEAGAARREVASAWAAALTLLFTKRFGAAAGAVVGGGGGEGGGGGGGAPAPPSPSTTSPSPEAVDAAAAAALDLARGALRAAGAALPADPAGIAPPLLRAARALVARARDAAGRALGAPGDPPSAARAPAALHGLLCDALAALPPARSSSAARADLHGIILDALRLAGPRAAATAPPAVLDALTAAAPGGSAARDAADDAQAELDAGVATALLAAAGGGGGGGTARGEAGGGGGGHPASGPTTGLVERAAADALEAGAAAAPARLTALALLSELVAGGGGGHAPSASAPDEMNDLFSNVAAAPAPAASAARGPRPRGGGPAFTASTARAQLAAAVRGSGLPARLAGELAAAPGDALLPRTPAPGAPPAAAVVLEMEAALALLLRAARAPGDGASQGGGPAAASAELAALASCAALDAEPEDPAASGWNGASFAPGGGGARPGTARAALARVLPPALRLAIVRLAEAVPPPAGGGSRPHSNGGGAGPADVLAAGVAFATAHRRALVRVLLEASSAGGGPQASVMMDGGGPGGGSTQQPAASAWEPGAGELEQASLALTLLSRLDRAAAAASSGSPTYTPSTNPLGSAGLELRDAALRCAARWFRLDAVPDAPPAARRLAAARAAGGAAGGAQAAAAAGLGSPAALAALTVSVRRLRLAAAAYVLGLVAPAPQPASSPALTLLAAPPAAAAGGAPGGGRLTLMSIKDALFQATEDLYGALDARRRALTSLATTAAAAIGGSGGGEGGEGGGSLALVLARPDQHHHHHPAPALPPLAARAAALAGATAADAAARDLLRLAETCLGILYWGLSPGPARDGAGGEAAVAALARLAAPALDHLARLAEGGGGGGGGPSGAALPGSSARAAALGALTRRVEAVLAPAGAAVGA